MDNSEKMRVETQTTVETLREEFDLLVRVIMEGEMTMNEMIIFIGT